MSIDKHGGWESHVPHGCMALFSLANAMLTTIHTTMLTTMLTTMHLQVGVAGMSAAESVYDGLDLAGSVMLKALREATSKVVHHR